MPMKSFRCELIRRSRSFVSANNSYPPSSLEKVREEIPQGGPGNRESDSRMQNPKRYPHGSKRSSAKELRLSPFRSLVALLLFTDVAGFAQHPDLAQRSLEDLMNIEVTSVSKR